MWLFKKIPIGVAWVASIVICVHGISFEEDVTLSDLQKAALDEFKKSMTPVVPHDYMKKDIYLVKWLRASNWNVKDAERLLLGNLKWRKDQNMDTIHQEDWSDIENDFHFKYFLDGRDKIGRSILYLDIGSLDLRKAILQGKTERLMRYCYKAVDDSCNLVSELGEKYHNISRGHAIFNLDGFNLIQHGCFQCTPVIARLVLNYANYFPGCCDQLILLNTPNIFGPTLEALRPLMNQDLRQGLKVFGRNSGAYKTALSKDFDFDLLPRGIGGSAHYNEVNEN